MEWKAIMEMRDPHEALKRIVQKVERENLSLQELEDRVEQYARMHGIPTDEMAFYPNGDKVIQ